MVGSGAPGLGGSVNHCRELLWAKPVGGWVPPEWLPIISSYRSFFFFSMLEVNLMYIKQERQLPQTR